MAHSRSWLQSYCALQNNISSSRPTQPADIYALGLVIYGVLAGSRPFHEQKWGEHEVVYHVMAGVRPAKPVDAEQIGFGDGTWELVEECWVKESTRRPTIDQVLKHLARVAVYSKIVGPTPESFGSAVISVASDSLSKLFISLPPTALTSMHKDKYNHFRQYWILPTVRP